jgi:hypothetical protein
LAKGPRYERCTEELRGRHEESQDRREGKRRMKKDLGKKRMEKR